MKAPCSQHLDHQAMNKWLPHWGNPTGKGPHLPLEDSLRAERFFHKGAHAPGELEQGCFPIARVEGDSPKDKLRDVPPDNEEEPPGVALAPCPSKKGGMETAP